MNQVWVGPAKRQTERIFDPPVLDAEAVVVDLRGVRNAALKMAHMLRDAGDSPTAPAHIFKVTKSFMCRDRYHPELQHYAWFIKLTRWYDSEYAGWTYNEYKGFN